MNVFRPTMYLILLMYLQLLSRPERIANLKADETNVHFIHRLHSNIFCQKNWVCGARTTVEKIDSDANCSTVYASYKTNGLGKCFRKFHIFVESKGQTRAISEQKGSSITIRQCLRPPRTTETAYAAAKLPYNGA